MTAVTIRFWAPISSKIAKKKFFKTFPQFQSIEFSNFLAQQKNIVVLCKMNEYSLKFIIIALFRNLTMNLRFVDLRTSRIILEFDEIMNAEKRR